MSDSRDSTAGGLITSTLLTPILLPVIYEWVESRAEERGS